METAQGHEPQRRAGGGEDETYEGADASPSRRHSTRCGCRGEQIREAQAAGGGEAGAWLVVGG